MAKGRSIKRSTARSNLSNSITVTNNTPPWWSVAPTIITTVSSLEALATAGLLVVGQSYQISDFETRYEDPNDGSFFVGDVEPLILTANSTTTFDAKVSSYFYKSDHILFDFTRNTIQQNPFFLAIYNLWVETFFNGEHANAFTPTATWFDVTLTNPLDFAETINIAVFDTDTPFEFWQLNGSATALNTINPWTVVDNGWNNYSFNMTQLGSLGNPYVYNNTKNYEFSFSAISTLGTTKGRITERFDPLQNNRMVVGNPNTENTDSADFRSSKIVRYYADWTADYPASTAAHMSSVPTDLVLESTWLWGTITKTVFVTANAKSALPIFGVYENVNNFYSCMWVRALNTTFADTCYGFKHHGIPASSWAHFQQSCVSVYIGSWCTVGWVFLNSVYWMKLNLGSELNAVFHANSFNNWRLTNASYTANVSEYVDIRKVSLEDAAVSNFYIQQILTGFKVSWWTWQSFYLNCANAEILDLKFVAGEWIYSSNMQFDYTDSFKRNKFVLWLGNTLSPTMGNNVFSWAEMSWNDFNLVAWFSNNQILCWYFTSNVIDGYIMTSNVASVTWSFNGNKIVNNASFIFSTFDWSIGESIVNGDFQVEIDVAWSVTFGRFLQWIWAFWSVVISGSLDNITATVAVTQGTITWSYANQTWNWLSPNWTLRGVRYVNTTGALNPQTIT